MPVGSRSSPCRTCWRVAASTHSSGRSSGSERRSRTTPAYGRSPATRGPRSGSAPTAATAPRPTCTGSSPGSGSRRSRAAPLGILSGGERRRAELARILFGGTDNLILDEPTNHLDVDAKSWLMGFLRGYRGAARREPRPRPARPGHHVSSISTRATCASTRARTRSTAPRVRWTRSASPGWRDARRRRSAG